MNRLQKAYMFLKKTFVKEHSLNGIVLIPKKQGTNQLPYWLKSISSLYYLKASAKDLKGIMLR